MGTNGRAIRRVWAAVGIIGAAALAAACEAEDPVVVLNDGRDIRNFAVIPGPGPLPGGTFSILGWSIVSKPPGEVDVFGRKGDALPYWTKGWGYRMPGTVMGTAANDTRLPALRQDEALATVKKQDAFFFANILGPEYWIPEAGLPIYDFWFELLGFKPNTRYWAGLVRYGTRVTGDPDQVEVLLGAEVQPDRLVPLGGQPGGSGTREVFFSGDNIFFAEANANPLVFGYAQSDANGTLVFDQIFWAFDSKGNRIWYDTKDPVPSLSPVAPNDYRPFSFPRYNYFVIWAEDPLRNPEAQPVVRIQFGNDLDLNGNPIPDAFAPFPKGPLTSAQLKAVKAVLAPARVSATFENLQAASYGLFLMNRNTGAELPAKAKLTITDAKGQSTSAEGNSFRGGEGVRTAAGVSNVTVGEPLSRYTDLVVKTGSARILWFNYADQKGTPNDPSDDTFATSGTFTFGAFDPSNPLIYKIAGSGRGAFYLDSLIVQLRRLPLPPPGYYYQGWVLNTKTGAVSPTGQPVLDERGDGFDRSSLKGLAGSILDYDRYVLTLQVQGGDASKPAAARIQVSEEGKFEAAASQASRR